MEIEVLRRENWSYSLEKRGERFFLSVVCGGVGTYEVDVELTKELASKYMEDEASLDTLAARIRNSPEAYKNGALLKNFPN